MSKGASDLSYGRPIRIGIVVIPRQRSTGAYNYLLNLCRALAEYERETLHPVLFFAKESQEEELSPFRLTGATVVCDSAFDEGRRQDSIKRALMFGRDRAIASAFRWHTVDVVFETGQFFGWRLGCPAIAWLTDFQHRNLKRLFSAAQFWRREIGFQAQVRTGRTLMVSSEDARADCEKYYPAARGSINVVRFAVRPGDYVSGEQVGTVRSQYGLPVHFFYLPNQFWIHKNHTCVISALTLLKREGVEVVVAASGNPSDPRDPAHMSKLRAAIAAAGAENNFKILGMIPTEHVRVLMQSCSALINPSFSEGWSTPVEEAKSMGTPMILSNLRVHKEQASGRASFFDPNSPAELMAILREFPERSDQQRERDRMAATSSGNAAFRGYAAAFRQIVQHAAKRT